MPKILSKAPAILAKTGTPMVLVLDVGTSSLRTALFGSDGIRIRASMAQETYRLDYSADGGAELSPAALRKAARRAIAKTLAFHRASPQFRKSPIAALGASCFWHSLIGVNKAGEPVTPIYTWGDSRCGRDAAALREKLDERTIHARTGCMLRTSYWPAKFRWMRRTRRELLKRAKRWMSPAEWLYLDLAGAAHTSLSMASGTGLLNAHTLQWDEEMLEECGIGEEALNPLSEASTGMERPMREFPELRGIPWFPPIGDGAASNLGSGATRSGLAAINVGTSGALRVMKTGGMAQAPFGLFCYRVDEHRYLIGGAISNAGNLRAWCLRELRLDDSRIESELARRPAPAHGLVSLPFWTAERAPTWEEEKRGVISGLTQNTSAIDILQALTEASYQRLALICGMVLAEEKTPPRFILSGGILKSHSSVQRLADVMNQPLYVNEEPEASLRGAAIYVLQKLGHSVPAFRMARPVRPRPKYAAIYAREREEMARLEKAITTAPQ